MSSAADQTERLYSAELQQLRLLTEVHHLLQARNPDGSYDLDVQTGVFENLVAKAQEDAMSGAVTVSFQPRADIVAETGEKQRVFLWRGLGRLATTEAVAESGYTYHATEAAYRRVAVEVREARRCQDTLQPGIAQMFLSPKMTRDDAPYEIADKEHLADEDAIRVYRAVTDDRGRVIGRRTESLLAQDVPLSAWVKMLRDPNNIFIFKKEKSIPVVNERSAIGVMEAFEHLDLPEQLLPEGPVTILAELVRYIDDPKDAALRESVVRQISRFREDQQRLRDEAVRVAREWLLFDVSLAESLATGIMQHDVKQLVMILQNQWSDETLMLLREHELPDGQYSMSSRLAAHLEQAWQKVHLGEVAIAIGDQRALQNIDESTAQRLAACSHRIRELELAGANPMVIAEQKAEQLREVSRSNVAPGGGCSGPNGFEFGRSPTDGTVAQRSGGSGTNDGTSNEGVGRIHKAVCRTSGCPSRPSEVLVGGCKICLGSCQPLWDRGIDPEKYYRRQQQAGVIQLNSLIAGVLAGRARSKAKTNSLEKSPA